jgi:uncharacterized protein (TIGR03067 family)
VFVKDTDRWVGIRKGTATLVGKLDEHGDFTQVYRFEKMYSMAPSFSFINFPGPKAKRVYEFRSGRLIKGDLMMEGNFVPEAGSTVLKFEDYQYSPDAIPIWNLPGTFMKKDNAVLQGKWVAEIGDEKTVEVTIKGFSLTWWTGAVATEGDAKRIGKKVGISVDYTYRVNASKRPQEMDLTVSDAQTGNKVFRGIYKLDGGKLTIRRSEPGEARPKDFEAREGDKNLSITLKQLP